MARYLRMVTRVIWHIGLYGILYIFHISQSIIAASNTVKLRLNSRISYRTTRRNDALTNQNSERVRRQGRVGINIFNICRRGKARQTNVIDYLVFSFCLHGIVFFLF